MALMWGSEMLPTPSCPLLRWLQQEPGLPPHPAVLSWAPESSMAQEKLVREVSGEAAGT